MNYLAIENHLKENLYELSEASQIHLTHVLKKKHGQFVSVIYPEVGRATAKIVSESLVAVEAWDNHPSNWVTSLHLPLPRPQTGKKIFHLAGAYSIDSLDFYYPKPENKAYLTSSLYRSLEWKKWVLEGMCQTGEFRFPKSNWQDSDLLSRESLFPKEVIAEDRTIRFVLDPSGIPFPTTWARDWNHVVMVLGEESGLRQSSLQYLEKRGFLKVALGTKTLRTEFALAQALYAIELLKANSARN